MSNGKKPNPQMTKTECSIVFPSHYHSSFVIDSTCNPVHAKTNVTSAAGFWRSEVCHRKKLNWRRQETERLTFGAKPGWSRCERSALWQRDTRHGDEPEAQKFNWRLVGQRRAGIASNN